MRKIIALLLALVMVFSLAACGSETEETAIKETAAAAIDSTDEPDEKKHVALTVWCNGEEADLFRQLAEVFAADNADFADITIAVEPVSDGDAMDWLIQDPENGADVFVFSSDWMEALLDVDALMFVPDEVGKADAMERNTGSSVDAAIFGEELYAFPMAVDYCPLMYYDKTVFTEEDLESWSSMLAAAEKAERQIAMDLNNGIYTYGFFTGAGLAVSIDEEGAVTCNWACDTGVKVSESIMELAAHPAFLNAAEVDFTSDKVCAAVSDFQSVRAVQETLGEDYGVCPVPSLDVDGEAVRMTVFSAYRLIGVNAFSENLVWSLKLGDYITNKENQLLCLEKCGLSPTNAAVAASDAVRNDSTLAALSAQINDSVPHNVGDQIIIPAAELSVVLSEGNPGGADLMDLLNKCADAMENSDN